MPFGVHQYQREKTDMKNKFLLYVCLIISTVLLGLIVRENILDQTPLANTIAAKETSEEQTEKIREQFQDMGLPLHEGRYWE